MSAAIKPPARPQLSPNHVQRSFHTIAETLISIRNAAKASHISASAREQWLLADEAENTGRMFFALAEELRRNAR